MNSEFDIKENLNLDLIEHKLNQLTVVKWLIM